MKSKIISIKFLRSVPGQWGSFNVWNIGLENGVIAEHLDKRTECSFSVGDFVEYTLKNKPGYVDEIKILYKIPLGLQTLNIDQIPETDELRVVQLKPNESTLVQVKNSMDDRKWIYEQAIKIYTTGRDYSFGDGDILEINNISKEIAKWLND